jgi:hypothetical protein
LTKLVARNYQAKDDYGIVCLYNRITGSNRSVDQHRWEWLETPEGRGSIWVITESESGQIVGHHGLIPIKLNIFGKPFLMGKTENTILHPKYAGTGIYFIYEKNFLTESKERFDLLYTTAGSGTPGRIRKKLGYEVVGGYSNYKKITKKAVLKDLLAYSIENRLSNKTLIVLSRIIICILSFALMAFFLKRHKENKELVFTSIESIDPISREIDSFWERNKIKFGITLDRNSKYLKWRIFENPNVKYGFLLARMKNRIVGYVITKIITANPKKGVIVDLVCENKNEILFGSILNAAIKRFSETGIHVVIFPTLSSKNVFNKILLKRGFLPIENIVRSISKIFKIKSNSEKPMLLIKIHNSEIDTASIFNPYHWYYTDLFKEGIS